MKNNSHNNLVKLVGAVLVPFIIVFAFYIQINGSDAPGGGFQAGAILASFVVFINLFIGPGTVLMLISVRQLKLFASMGIFLYMLPGFFALAAGANFLDYFTLSFVQEAQKTGIIIVEWGVGFTVFASLSLIYLKIASRGSRYDIE